MKTQWENSRQRYAKVIDNLTGLIKEIDHLATFYENINMGFAQRLYEEELIGIMDGTGCLDPYEKEFAEILKALKAQETHLEQFRDKVNLMSIKDHVNYPTN